MSKNSLGLKGLVKVEHYNAAGEHVDTYDFPNGITTEGINHILETQFRSGAAVGTWYIGLVDNSGWTAWADADTMASHAGWSESTAYTEGTRQAWTPGAAAAKSMTNGTTVDFSINATVTMKGVFITSGSAKSGTSGTLWSTAAFASTVNVASGDTFKITYTVNG